MAKKFNQIYKVAKETAYATQAAAFVLAASLNSVVDFTPVARHNGTVDSGAASVDYNIQRIKRIKGQDVANATANTTSAALAALDGFSEVDWETIGVATGSLRSIGVKVGINQEIDIDSMGEGHAKAVADSVNLQLIERHERLLDEVVGEYIAGGSKKTDGELDLAGANTEAFDTLSDAADEVMLFSDDFKHMSSESNMLIILHPTVARKVAKEIGTVFNQEAPIYTTGFKSNKSINGIPVIVDPNLNKYQVAKAAAGTADTRLGAIVMDIEALAFKAADESKPIMTDLGLTKFAGKFFYSIEKLIDPSRVKVLNIKDTTIKASQTDKASA